jgi:hypothetical protein
MKKKHCVRLKLESGFSVSVQASETHYSIPRNDDGPYSHVEFGNPSIAETMIREYAEDRSNLLGTVYGYVPAGVLLAVIIKHGGIKSGNHPPLDMNLEQANIFTKTLFEID